ncbi:MAG: hypothetical protein AB7O26_12475 [Planctomycetaceae bacterium]
MNRPRSPSPRNTDLENFIRPLANYICANDKPQAALQNVLAAVLHEVRETNRAARAQFGVYSENCCS